MRKAYHKKALSLLQEKPENIFIVHYSCQSLNDGNDGYSPRVTSIVVRNYETRTTYSFSIHLEAETQKVAKADVEKNYDQLEKAMLKKFFCFVKGNASGFWVHWNMRNIHYGFEALEHRYKALGASEQDITSIPEVNRFNLSDLITDVYGHDCVSHPRMGTLMNLNGGVPKGFLSGEDETKAFSNKEFVKLHESTLCKVGWFSKMLSLLFKRKIKTERSGFLIKLGEFSDCMPVKVAGAVLSIYGIIQLLILAVQWASSNPGGAA